VGHVSVGYGVVLGRVGLGVFGLEVGPGGHSSVSTAPQVPPRKTESEDPNSLPLPINLPLT